jgi:hypothetical protein
VLDDELLDSSMPDAGHLVHLWQVIDRDMMKGGPVANLLARAREEAREALAALVGVEATDQKLILRLQNEVRRYADLVRWVQATLQSGRNAWLELNDEERQSVLQATGVLE